MAGIVNSSGETFVVSSGKSVVGVRACGSMVLVELLTPKEVLGTNLDVLGKAVQTENHGYIRAIGPAVKPEIFGFSVGDRVLVSGGGFKVPNYDESHRERFLMDTHSIKGVLLEG